MELTGKIIQLLPLQKGKSAKGEWQKQEFILETQEQYPKKICISVWNNKVDVNNLEGNLIKAFIEIESREYNGKWYTDVKAWKIEKLNHNKPTNGDKTEQNDSSISNMPWDNEVNNENDILPF